MPVGRWKQGNSREATHLPSCAGCNWAHTALAGWPAAKAAGFFSCLQTRKKPDFIRGGSCPPRAPLRLCCRSKCKSQKLRKTFSPVFRQEKSQISFEAGLAPLELPCGSVAAQSANHRSCGKHSSLSLDKKKPDFIRGGSCPLELPCGSVAAQSAKHRSCGKHSPLSFDKKKAGIHSRREKWCHALTISRCRAYHSCGGTRCVPNPTQMKGEHHAPLPE